MEQLFKILDFPDNEKFTKTLESIKILCYALITNKICNAFGLYLNYNFDYTIKNTANELTKGKFMVPIIIFLFLFLFGVRLLPKFCLFIIKSIYHIILESNKKKYSHILWGKRLGIISIKKNKIVKGHRFYENKKLYNKYGKKHPFLDSYEVWSIFILILIVTNIYNLNQFLQPFVVAMYILTYFGIIGMVLRSIIFWHARWMLLLVFLSIGKPFDEKQLNKVYSK